MAYSSRPSSFHSLIVLALSIGLGVMALAIGYKAVKTNTEQRSKAAETTYLYRSWDFSTGNIQGWALSTGKSLMVDTGRLVVYPLNSTAIISTGTSVYLPTGLRSIKVRASIGNVISVPKDGGGITSPQPLGSEVQGVSVQAAYGTPTPAPVVARSGCVSPPMWLYASPFGKYLYYFPGFCQQPLPVVTPPPVARFPITTPTPTRNPYPVPIFKPTSTPSRSPLAKPSQAITYGCNTKCTANSNCQLGLACVGGVCRNLACTGSTNCVCPMTPTPTAYPRMTPTPTAYPKMTPPPPAPPSGYITPSPTPIQGTMEVMLTLVDKTGAKVAPIVVSTPVTVGLIKDYEIPLPSLGDLNIAGVMITFKGIPNENPIAISAINIMGPVITPSPTPTQTFMPVNHVYWKTNTVQLEADNFTITIDGKPFPLNAANMLVHSDPGTPQYTTLEIDWPGKPEMRFYMYFSYAPGDFWKVTSMRTYDGAIPGNWLYYDGFIGNVLGSPHINSIADFTSKDGRGKVHMANLHLSAFGSVSTTPSPTPTPSPRITTYTCPTVEYINCMPQTGDQPSPRTYSCSPDYINWAQANCPGFRGAAY